MNNTMESNDQIQHQAEQTTSSRSKFNMVVLWRQKSKDRSRSYQQTTHQKTQTGIKTATKHTNEVKKDNNKITNYRQKAINK